MFKMIFDTSDLTESAKRFQMGVKIIWGDMEDATLDDYYTCFKTYLIAVGFVESSIDDFFMVEEKDNKGD